MKSLNAIAMAGTGVAARASSQLVLLFVTIIATRFLLPAEFGVFSVAAACITLVRTILYSGAYEYLLKAPDLKRVSTECLIVNTAACLSLSSALVVFAFYSNGLFGTEELRRVLLILIPSNYVAVFTAWQEAQLLRSGRVQLYYGVTLATEIVSGAVALVLFEAHWGINALIAQTYARTIGLALAYLCIQRPAFSTAVSVKVIKEVGRWAASRYAAVFIGFTFNYGADFVLGVFMSTAASGLYRAANRIATAVSDMFAQPTRTFGVTLFSRRAALGESPSDLWPKILTASTVVGWPALAGLATASKFLIPMTLGPKWAATAPLVAILCLLKSFSIMGAVTNPLLVAFNRQNFLLVVQVISSAATMVALLVFARFGAVAAAWAVTIVAALANFGLLAMAIKAFSGSGRALVQCLPTIVIPTIATVTGAQACIFLSSWSGHTNKWAIVALVVSGGIVAWAAASIPFRRPIGRSIKALAGG
jgi:O-antigen/teichoic acid export membrane protein